MITIAQVTCWWFRSCKTVFWLRTEQNCRLCYMYYLVSEDSFWPDDFVKDVLTHVCINSRQRIVQEVYISLSVDSPGQAHPLLLPT